MEKLKNEYVKAMEYLEKDPVQSWARCYFDRTSKCECYNNNCLESFNKWMLDVKYMPIVKLVDKYTLMLSKQFYDRKICGSDVCDDSLVPKVLEIIEKLDKKYVQV
ncbi:hypothetical protein FRX31_005191 [Thalictrum thalictroides]|uniref:Uncharacterized protein n=1 Tax=Thalictrum thalictroides TaxID=46969 RepID=A0A7J6X9Y4_THATH|nr:hypothetical protein FRX31_005191 [Thalictrum thalictroides]